MSEVPERIWADPDHWIEGPVLSDLANQGYTEYIRADRIEELEAQVRAADALAEKLEDAVEELRFLIPGYAGAAVTEQQVEEDVSDYVAALAAYRATKEGGAQRRGA